MIGASVNVQGVMSDWNIQDLAGSAQTGEFSYSIIGGSYAHGFSNGHPVEAIQFGRSYGLDIGAAKGTSDTSVWWYQTLGNGRVTAKPPAALQGNWPYLMGLPGSYKP
jgi:hypothetical protein